jgi:hypothetical protein
MRFEIAPLRTCVATDPTIPHKSWIHRSGIAALTIAAAIVCVHAWSLMRFPPPFVDEAWAANRGWALLTTGVAFGDLDAGVFQHFEGYWNYFPLLPTAIQAFAMWLAGAPQLLALRLVSLAFGLILLRACYSLGQHAGGRDAGLTAVVFTALSLPFFYSAHLARWDMMIAALGYTTLALVTSNTDRRTGRAFLAGLLGGLAIEIHPHAALFIPVVAALYLFRSRWAVISSRDFWAWLAGTSLGGSLYLFVHLRTSPASFLALMRLAHGPTHTPPIATLDGHVMFTAVQESLAFLVRANGLWFFAFLAAAAWLLSTRNRHVVWIAGLTLTSFTFLVHNRFLYYAILTTPAMTLTIAVFAATVSRLPRRDMFTRVTAGAVAACLGLGVALTLPHLLRANGSADFARVAERLRLVVRTDDTIMGSQTYWLSLRTHRFYSWEQLVYFQRFYPNSHLSDAVSAFKPDILIIDGHFSQFITAPGESTSYGLNLSISKPELSRLLASSARLIDAFDGGAYGQIRVFRFSWASNSVRAY